MASAVSLNTHHVDAVNVKVFLDSIPAVLKLSYFTANTQNSSAPITGFVKSTQEFTMYFKDFD